MDWKETFEDLWWGSFDNDGEKNSHEYDKMVSFIENLLEQERQRMSDEIEKLKLEVPNPYGDWVRVPRVNMLLDKAKAIINK